MANRRLTSDELERANDLLADVRSKLDALAGGDKDLLFAYRRKIAKELGYDERGKPVERRILKAQKRVEQGGLCAICRKPLPEKYAELDRLNAADGYTRENTRLIHHECHIVQQASKGYT
jgi:UTP:GlnB (protein PII) uridylyltransferase